MKEKEEKKRPVIDLDNMKFTKPESDWVDVIIRDGKSNLKEDEQSERENPGTE